MSQGPDNRFQGPGPLREPHAQPHAPARVRAFDTAHLPPVPPDPAGAPRPALPLLTVRPVTGSPPGGAGRPASRRGGCWVTLYKALLAAVPALQPGGPVDVRPPARRGGQWLLDASPVAPRRLPGLGKVARFAIAPLSSEHFLLPAAGGKRRANGTVGYCEVLMFQLGPEIRTPVTLADRWGHPVTGTVGTGVYVLLPVRPGGGA